jgi:hypothetical protein
VSGDADAVETEIAVCPYEWVSSSTAGDTAECETALPPGVEDAAIRCGQPGWSCHQQ